MAVEPQAKPDAAHQIGLNVAGLVDAMSKQLDADDGERFGVVETVAPSAGKTGKSPGRWPSRLPPLTLARARVDEVERVADAARDVISAGAVSGSGAASAAGFTGAAPPRLAAALAKKKSRALRCMCACENKPTARASWRGKLAGFDRMRPVMRRRAA